MITNNNKGFTLVEVIIAILAFSIICGTVLQLFILSGNMEDKTYNYEMSNINAQSAMELTRLVNSPYELENIKYFNFPKYNLEGEKISVTVFFDEKWFQIPENTDKTAFLLHILIEPEKTVNIDNTILSGLYNIKATVKSVNNYEFISLKSKRFYNFSQGGLS